MTGNHVEGLDRLFSLIVLFPQRAHISKHHIVHLQYIPFLHIKDISIKFLKCFLKFELNCTLWVLLGNPATHAPWLLGPLLGVLVSSSQGSLPTGVGPLLLPSPASWTGGGVSLGLCPAYYCLSVSSDLAAPSSGLCLQGFP